MKSLLTFVLLLPPIYLFSQQHVNTTIDTKKADSLFLDKNYKQAVLTYSSLAQTPKLKTDTNILYKAMVCFAALKNVDSCIYYFSRLAGSGYNNLSRLQKDDRLTHIKANERWYEILQKIRKQNVPIEPLVTEFKELLHTYQINYQVYQLMLGRYGHGAPVVKALRAQFKYDDSITLYKVMSIVNTYGWLGKKRFGSVGPDVILITILHANLAVQKKYFSVVIEAAKNGDYPPESLGFLADVIALSEIGKQVYGTLISSRRYRNRYVPYPIINETEVDTRRKSIGLGTLNEFLVSYNPAFLEQFYLIE